MTLRRGLALTAAAVVVLAGLAGAAVRFPSLRHGVASVLGDGQAARAPSSAWRGVGVFYDGPSSPGDPPIPDEPWSQTIWWTQGWDLYHARSGDDARLIRAFAGENTNVTVFVTFPIYLADDARFGGEMLGRLGVVVNDFHQAGFRVALVFTHPEITATAKQIDPIGNPSDLGYVAGNMQRALEFGHVKDQVDLVSVAYQGQSGSHAPWQVLAYHRSVKAMVNLEGLPFDVMVTGHWTDAHESQGGYTLQSISPAAGASDGLLLGEWSHDRLPTTLGLVVPGVFSTDQVWIVDEMDDCDLNQRTSAHDLPCAHHRMEEDVYWWFRAALVAGLTHVATGEWSDGGGDVLPRYGVLRADADGFTTKGVMFHDFIVGRDDLDRLSPGNLTTSG